MQNYFYRFTLIIILLAVIFFGFFSTTKIVCRDYGSCKERIEYISFGKKTSVIKENIISQFLYKEKIQKPVSWYKTERCCTGFFKMEVHKENYILNRESLIKQLETVIEKKLKEKMNDNNYINEFLKPKLLIFLDSLGKRDLEKLEEIIYLIEEN